MKDAYLLLFVLFRFAMLRGSRLVVVDIVRGHPIAMFRGSRFVAVAIFFNGL